jgi:glycine/D-amino acid oxidase-like deaminating enzyme
MNATKPQGLPSSLWAATACASPTYSSTARDRSADVVIIGGGYTGLSTALHLAKAGAEVVVLEASEPGWGASGRNGGQIIAGLKHDPDTLDATFGTRLGSAMTQTMGGSADLVRALIEQYQIDCHPRFTGWIQGAHGAKPFEELVVPRCTQWRQRGVEAKLLDRRQMAVAVGSAPDAYYGGWFDPRGGVLQPLSYARGLAAAAMREGVTVHAGAPVLAVSRDGDSWRAEIPGGAIKTRKVVIATNAYTDDLWKDLRRTVIPVTSFQIATRPLPAEIGATILPEGQGVADTRRLLLYFRRDHEGRLVMGGRSPVDDNPTLEHSAALQAAIARIFPRAAGQPIEFAWSGKVAITKDKYPHLHILAPGMFAALGCNGRGVAACTMIGKVLADLVSGHAAPADLPLPVTAPDRFALHALRKLGVFALSQYYRLLDMLDSRG